MPSALPKTPASSPAPDLLSTDALQGLRLDSHSSEPYYLQLQRQIEAMVASGALPAGSNLPSERVLAEEHRPYPRIVAEWLSR